MFAGPDGQNGRVLTNISTKHMLEFGANWLQAPHEKVWHHLFRLGHNCREEPTRTRQPFESVY